MSSAPSESGALALARRSPEVVRAKDKAAWLALFAGDASVEDPVGAGAYVGPARLSSFWDVFIAPQRDIEFRTRRDFASGEHVIRYVDIASITPVSDEPFVIPAMVEYRVRGEQIRVLRAFWEPRHAVTWHAQQGAKGLGGLLSHGMRTARGLGLGATMGFSKALGVGLTRGAGQALADRLCVSMRDEGALARLLDSAVVSIEGAVNDVAGLVAASEDFAIEEVIVAGSHLACVLGAGDRAVAALLDVDAGRVRRFDAIAV